MAPKRKATAVTLRPAKKGERSKPAETEPVQVALFLALPGELRNTIYELCFPQVPVECDLLTAPALLSGRSLLLVNKQVYNESDNGANDLSDKLVEWAQKLSENDAQYITHLQFRTTAFNRPAHKYPLTIDVRQSIVQDSAASWRTHQLAGVLSWANAVELYISRRCYLSRQKRSRMRKSKNAYSGEVFHWEAEEIASIVKFVLEQAETHSP